MIRNNESWDLGEPELNDRGQPVIHDIASQLGCIRPSPDLPVAFLEGSEDFAELQAQLQPARTEIRAEDTGSRRLSESSPSSPSLAHAERAISTESDCSVLSKDYNQNLWVQQQRQRHTGAKVKPSLAITTSVKSTPVRIQWSREAEASHASTYSTRASFDTNTSIPSPIYADFQTQSPWFHKASPFPSWSPNDFLDLPNKPDLTAQLQYPNMSNPGLDESQLQPMDLVERSVLNCADGTINAHMLACNGYDPNSQRDSLMFGGEYESQIDRA